MSKLAIDGGTPVLTAPLRPNKVISENDIEMASSAMRISMSGYLGGKSKGGIFCERLEAMFREILEVEHALLVNSATSGLWAASNAIRRPGSRDPKVMVSPYTMSATAAAPKIAGARIVFGDIDTETFCLMPAEIPEDADGVVVTNLFGHPAELAEMRKICDRIGAIMIEDSAQAPFAQEDGRYAGTVGHVGVYSFNVHKHFQCGEGGVVLTDDDEIAETVSSLRNHGELSVPNYRGCGLNLRLTEPQAAIILSQLERWCVILTLRRELATFLTESCWDYNNIVIPIERTGCEHSYYAWAIKVAHDRDWFVAAMNAEGVPMTAGYNPLYNLHQFKATPRNNVEAVDKELAYFEVCAYDPTPHQRAGIKDAFHKVCEAHEKRGS